MPSRRNASSKAGPAQSDGVPAGPLRHGPLPRPLTPRSIIASLLLGIHPPRLRGTLLVRWCGLMGMAEGTTRSRSPAWSTPAS